MLLYKFYYIKQKIKTVLYKLPIGMWKSCQNYIVQASSTVKRPQVHYKFQKNSLKTNHTLKIEI